MDSLSTYFTDLFSQVSELKEAGCGAFSFFLNYFCDTF
jgi:hypothetical protein